MRVRFLITAPIWVECFLLRRPDPPVLVAVYEFEKKQNKADAGLVQLLDYNLTR